ncbi:TetR/AcrR family transcriptional regulator [Blastococcus jejuensis]|uniref:TetR/AcrR family transcriptional regulator n=1 Tax=Blastococcus jejuensis TaxID=351224 RepID=A0ABP6PFM0_9ACTN
MTDRRAARYAATRAEILAAAWRLARERGLGGWALRDVAEAVGMRTPSLYVYVAGKNDLYDAMFADGNAELLRRVEAAEADVAARELPAAEVLRVAARLYVDFCVEDPARYELLFLRTIPGFEPSEPSYALAREVLDRMVPVLAAAGAGAPEQVDLWTALVGGLAAQQVSNDPGGDRWRRLVDRAVDMFAAAELPPRG